MNNGHRVIDIDDPEPSKIPEDADWQETNKLPNGIEERWRDGPTIFIHRRTWDTFDIGYGTKTVFRDVYTTEPAEIEWRYIRDACEVVRDDDHTAPWDNCDGYEHTVVEFSDGAWRTCFSKSVGYYSPTSYNGCSGAIFIDDCDVSDWGIYDYHRGRGASKQVAREREAANKRRTIRQLARWYGEGWQWYGVRCEFRVGNNTYEDSVWGIDDYSYAENWIVTEIADQVAYQVEQDGFTVVERPKHYEEDRATQLKERFKRQIHEQDWDDDV